MQVLDEFREGQMVNRHNGDWSEEECMTRSSSRKVCKYTSSWLHSILVNVSLIDFVLQRKSADTSTSSITLEDIESIMVSPPHSFPYALQYVHSSHLSFVARHMLGSTLTF